MPQSQRFWIWLPAWGFWCRVCIFSAWRFLHISDWLKPFLSFQQVGSTAYERLACLLRSFEKHSSSHNSSARLKFCMFSPCLLGLFCGCFGPSPTFWKPACSIYLRLKIVRRCFLFLICDLRLIVDKYSVYPVPHPNGNKRYRNSMGSSTFLYNRHDSISTTL